MKFTILAIGRLKEQYFIDAAAEYEKRLSRYAKVQTAEVPDADAALKYIDTHGGFVIALAVEGEQKSSEELAARLEAWMNEGKSEIIFLIGDADGLPEALLSRADEKISFSRMTFPHRLFRVLLLEQLYRAMRIIRNEPYHK